MLEGQIMFKKSKKPQKQKKLEELNDVKQQNVINQPYSMHNNKKQQSGAQYELLNIGITVRKPSEMFMFSGQNLVHGVSNQLVYSPMSSTSQNSLTNHKSQQTATTFCRSIETKLDVAKENMVVLKSKKRKFPPWHQVVADGYFKFHDMRTAELEWARSTARLPEMECKEIAGPIWVGNLEKRLKLTTQFMQFLFRSVPSVVLSENAAKHCDCVTYYAAKLALGDACNLCSSSGKNTTSKHSRQHDLSKTVQDFIARFKRLEDEFSRLEQRKLSIRELRMDFQDLEKVSMVSSVSGVVKTNPMPNMVPKGQSCLFL